MANYIGSPVKRVEDPRFLRGKGRYVSNLELPEMAHLAILRSPHSHAKIKSIDTKKAKALDGVIAVYTGQDLVDGGVGSIPAGWNVPEQKTPTHYPLTIDKACRNWCSSCC